MKDEELLANLLSFTEAVTSFWVENLFDSPRIGPVNIPIVYRERKESKLCMCSKRVSSEKKRSAGAETLSVVSLSSYLHQWPSASLASRSFR